MRINISAIENENTLTEVKAATAKEVTGGETNIALDWFSRTTGPTSGQAIVFREIYANPNGTNVSFAGRWWS